MALLRIESRKLVHSGKEWCCAAMEDQRRNNDQNFIELDAFWQPILRVLRGFSRGTSPVCAWRGEIAFREAQFREPASQFAEPTRF